MRGKIIITIVTGVVVAALMALAWWWFLYRAPNTTPTTGTFGTSQNKPPTGSSTTTPTNIGSPVGGATRKPSGTLAFNSPDGQLVGNYSVVPNDNGTYAVTPLNGAGSLGSGDYVITIDNVTSNYVVAPVGTDGTTTLYTIDLQPYGAGNGDNGIYGAGGGAATSTLVIGGGDLGLGTVDTPNVNWLANTGGGTVFNPTAINQIAGSNPTGGLLPNIGGGSGGTSGGGGGLGIGGALLGAAGAGVISCAGLYIAAQIGLITPNAFISVQQNNAIDNGKQVLDCIARGIAKAAVQQITASVVNWINNGFNGSPSFVTNPTQFFANVADNAAGQFIKGSALSFLCSPFQLQIRIAIAQSYANRNANSCTLTGVINNVSSFMNGNFSAGGWPGFLAFTTVPTNNPYGAYAYGSIGLNATVNTALTQKLNEVNQGRGFLSFQQQQHCKTQFTPPTNLNPNQVSTTLGSGNGAVVLGAGVGSANSQSVTAFSAGGDVLPNGESAPTTYEVCDLVTTTPGSVIAGAIDKKLGEDQDSLNLAKSFDEIISALITQLTTKALQGGLSNLSGYSGYSSDYYTPDQIAAQSAGQGLLSQMRGDVSIAQQYGAVQQGSIGDIQNVQSQLNDLGNCWSAFGAQAAGTSAGTQALANAQQASSTVAQLQGQVDALNNSITTINNSIVTLEQLESQALSVASTNDVSALTSTYNADKAQGSIFSSSDLTTAQQDRTTLQANLATQAQAAQAGLAQCHTQTAQFVPTQTTSASTNNSGNGSQ